jgi:hypothetical protein
VSAVLPTRNGRVRTTPVGLVLPETPGDRLTAPELRDLARRLSSLLVWALGDLAFACEFEGIRLDDLAEVTGLPASLLKTANGLAGAFDLRDRRALLSWLHHRVIADAPDQEREEWLQRASSHGWTPAELARQLAAAAERLAA